MPVPADSSKKTVSKMQMHPQTSAISGSLMYRITCHWFATYTRKERPLLVDFNVFLLVYCEFGFWGNFAALPSILKGSIIDWELAFWEQSCLVVAESSTRISTCEQTHTSPLSHIVESLDSDPITRTKSTVTDGGRSWRLTEAFGGGVRHQTSA